MDSDDPGRSSSSRNIFKEIFKFYKRRNTEEFEDTYDIRQFRKTPKNLLNLNIIHKNEIGIDWETMYGLPHPKEWFVYTFSAKPGLFYIRNPFKTAVERYWVARCLKDFTRKPNPLNIDSQNIISEDDDWWEFCHRECNRGVSRSVLEKVRWATLGYHFNWNTKTYSEENRGEFPEDLKSMCQDIGKVLGFPDFNPQAGIINMYHRDSSLNGHTDHSEKNVNAPLFSFSFGQSAVFLLGGKTFREHPLRLLVKSGDIIILSKESRLAYHGVPRILEPEIKSWNEEMDLNDKVMKSPILDNGLLSDVVKREFWSPFESYVNRSRINLSVRQVF